MKVSVQFNIGMTFALIGYAVIISPVLIDDPTPLLVESMFPESVTLQVVVGLVSGILGIIAGMYIVRALWNRLFPSLCGWKEITLAESYAVSLLVAMFVIQ